MEETSLAIYFIWIQAKSELIMLIMLIKQIANYQLSTINTYRKRTHFRASQVLNLEPPPERWRKEFSGNKKRREEKKGKE